MNSTLLDDARRTSHWYLKLLQMQEEEKRLDNELDLLMDGVKDVTDESITQATLQRGDELYAAIAAIKVAIEVHWDNYVNDIY